MTHLGDRVPVNVNAALDGLPRLTIDVGTRRVPAFRSVGILGYHVALVMALLASLRSGLPIVTALGLSAVAGLSFFGWGLLRRALTGRETLVLIEYVWVAIAAVSGFLIASGGDVRSGLDVFCAAVPWFLAFGRLACATVGCCHGVPSPIGLRYGEPHPLPPRLRGRRLLPVQLIEAAALIAIGVVALVAVGSAPGTATVWFLTSYAVVRFGTERLRGDPRPHLAGIHVAKATAALQLAAGIAAAEAWLVPGPPGRALFIGAAALVAALAAGLGLTVVRGRPAVLAPDQLDETWELVHRLGVGLSPGDNTASGQTSAGMSVAVSPAPDGWHVSLAHSNEPTFGVALALGGASVETVRGVTHLRMTTDDGLEAADDPVERYFGRPAVSA